MNNDKWRDRIDRCSNMFRVRQFLDASHTRRMMLSTVWEEEISARLGSNFPAVTGVERIPTVRFTRPVKSGPASLLSTGAHYTQRLIQHDCVKIEKLQHCMSAETSVGEEADRMQAIPTGSHLITIYGSEVETEDDGL